MLWVYDYGLLLLEVISIGVVAKILFGGKFSKHKWRYFLFGLITTIVILLEKMENKDFLSNNRNIIICMFLLLLCFEFGIIRMIMCGFLSYFVYSFLTLIFVLIFENVFSRESQGITVLGSIMGTVFLFILLYLYCKKNHKSIDVSRNKWLSILAGILIFIGIYMAGYPYFNISEFHKPAYILYFAVFGILVIIFGVSYVAIINNNYEYKYKEKISTEKTKLMHDYYGLIEARDLEMRRFRHDYKNHIRGIIYYVNEEKYEDLKTYVQSMYEDSVFERDIYDVGLNFVNAILCKYYDETKEENIKLQVSGDASPASGIDDYDWSTIIPNLLNNAIEATRQVEDEDKTIEISFKYIRNKIVVSVTNPIKDNVNIPDLANIKTSKKDKINHGFGIKNIIKTVEKYNGDISCEVNDSNVNITVWMICNQIS